MSIRESEWFANLHNKPVKRVNEQFERNKERLKEGVDYFLVDKGEFSESLSATQTFIPNNVKDIKLFTERGYLKLVKSFTDDLSWQVQDLLVDSYFKLKEMLSSKDALLLDIVKAEGEIAKILKYLCKGSQLYSSCEYQGTGRNNLFKFLRREGVLMKNNAPKQEYVNKGWFKLVEYKVNEEVKIKTLVYQKGLDGIRKMLDEAGLLPEAR